MLKNYEHPMQPLFIQTFGLGETIWVNKSWGTWGIFGQLISTHFGTVSPCFMVSVNPKQTSNFLGQSWTGEEGSY